MKKTVTPNIRFSYVDKDHCIILLLDFLRNEVAELDLADAYWQSEHHRFHYNEFAQVICDMDPLSYHQVGLAVPGTFLERGTV